MKDNDFFKEHQKLISAIEKKGYKDKNGNLISDDSDFKKLCKEFKDSVGFQIGNYNSYEELKKKFEKLAVAYCLEVNISTPFD